MSDSKPTAGLLELARLYNIQTAYYGVHHRRYQAPVEGLLGALKALGAPVESLNDVTAAQRERRESFYRRIMEPVTVVWEGGPPAVTVRLPARVADNKITARLDMESGESGEFAIPLDRSRVIDKADIEGELYITRQFSLPQKLSPGYHKFSLNIKNISAESMIISAPVKACADKTTGRGWGAFLPLYALRREKGWGSGDYSGLGKLAQWVAEAGGNVVATLPLLPVFLDEPFEPSPYAPVSRMLWNEFYVDITKEPEFNDCGPARSLAASLQTEIKARQEELMVDYRKIMIMKRRVMAEMSRYLMSTSGSRLDEYNSFVRENPVAADYARFRSVMEKQGKTWHDWPQRLHDGDIREGDYDKDIHDYYLYTQWLAHRQVEALKESACRRGTKLYFDLPVGVHPDGYDVWRHRDIFARGTRAGAPPDTVFTNGQDWGFPPLHPEKIRDRRYGYIIDYLRHNLKCADMLRIDHVMGLHRLFWIPPGLDADRGVYVHYNAGELYAILSLESHRSRSTIVGEDLGIVPSYVQTAMLRHGLWRLYIMYYEIAGQDILGRVPAKVIASLNTHDMPTFAAFWEGTDIPERKSLGLVDAAGAGQEYRARKSVKTTIVKGLRNGKFLQKVDAGTRAVFQACLGFLAASPARVVLVNLEDLWGEKRSQNVPGTGEKYPSWRYKARYSMEEFCRMKDVRDILEKISAWRKEALRK
jgi:4-alpha-glucanotransferase